MKKLAHVVSAAVAAACLFTIVSRAEPEPADAMWVWQFDTAAATAELRQELIQFSLRHRIRVLFVGTDPALADHEDEYAELIGLAHSHGIRVFALAGKAVWAKKEHHEEALDRLEQVLSFNERHPERRFDGIQFDIEPYTLPEFRGDAEAIGSQFVRLIAKAAGMISERGHALELNVAIPFWYATGDPPVVVDYDGVRKPLSHHLLDAADSVSIMAYRDSAEEQIAVARAELDYAAKVGKKAYIGAETGPPDGEGIPEQVTYYHQELWFFHEQLEAVRRHYAKHPAFAGVAIHSYDSFRNMQERERQQLRQREQRYLELKAAGIMSGYADGGPGFGQRATRAETAAVAARLGGFSEPLPVSPDEPRFADVPPEAWYAGWVETVFRMGVMNGKGGRKFAPEAAVTLEELSAAMARTAGLAYADGADVEGASGWANGWIAALRGIGAAPRAVDYTRAALRDDLVDMAYAVYQYMRGLNP